MCRGGDDFFYELWYVGGGDDFVCGGPVMISCMSFGVCRL